LIISRYVYSIFNYSIIYNKFYINY